MQQPRRLRKFNTRDSYPGEGLDNDHCQAVVANGFVFLRGQVGTDLETGETVGLGDPGAQAEQAMRNVQRLLAEAGSTLEHVVKIVVYVTERAHRTPVYRAIGQALKGVYPVSTGLIVSGLAKEEWLMEIDVTAVLRERGAP